MKWSDLYISIGGFEGFWSIEVTFFNFPLFQAQIRITKVVILQTEIFVHALTSQLDNVNQAFRNGGILLRKLPFGSGLIIALVPVGKLLRQDGRKIQITEIQLLILFFLRVVLHVVPHVPLGALLRVELLEFQPVLVHSLGLEDFYFIFQLFEVV